MNKDDTEIWKQIPGYPGYEASSHGNFRSLDREILYFYGRYKKWLTKKTKGKTLTPYLSRSTGYYRVYIGAPNQNSHKLAHRLIYETFWGEIGKKMQINHKDGDKKNNHINNLEIVTARENSHHALKNKIRFSCPSHKEPLSEAEIYAIRFFYQKGMGVILSKVFNRHHDTIMRIVHKKTRFGFGHITKESIAAANLATKRI